MHIEPGILSSAKIAFANVAAVGMLAACAPALVKRPALLLRTALAALFFSIFMQVFHMPVGASELHFVGAMPIYLLLGFVPTLFGFAFGLLLQGLLFDPQDLAHLAVNSLSLMVPLAAVHYGLGKRLAGKFTVANIVKLDFAFYAGVTLMVGFWLSMGTEPTPLANWATFAASYLALVLVEPLVTLAIVRAARGFKDSNWAQLCLDERVTAAA
ncbi:energy-coupling factor ABC transporter permease [Brachymonas denitrificans]|uniref:energy-coupling factor ABC transporter permease n=1 Tax=Brachymonas denitrificans TaxID=28220 RepID=UPI001BD08F57|nr:energy-coupling factor ABC transporter permease [Brachymonas denitrificans]